MTYWARLTWQVPDAVALAEDLERRLGLRAIAGGPVPGALTVALGSAIVELRPWRSESAEDRPVASGRLVFEPVPGGEEAPRSGAPDVHAAPELPPILVGVGWATVDLDRAEAELDPWLAPRPGARAGDGDGDGEGAGDGEGGGHGEGDGDSDPDDGAEPHLGARTRRRGAGGLPAGTIVLLEPSTEGRLAASLARDGEGPCVLYLGTPGPLRAWLRAARSRGVRTSAVRPGPLGPSALVLGGATAGPHLVLVDPSAFPPAVPSGGPPAGTMRA
jgi:hypothetical protein